MSFKNRRRPVNLAPHTRWANCCLEQEQFPTGHSLGLWQAAEQNDPYAQYRLGKLLIAGAEGVEGYDAAVQLLKGSAIRRNSFAQYTLGKLYLLGHEVQAAAKKLCAISHRRRHGQHLRSILSTIRRTSPVRRREPLSFGCSIRSAAYSTTPPSLPSMQMQMDRSITADPRRSAWQWDTRRMTMRIMG